MKRRIVLFLLPSVLLAGKLTPEDRLKLIRGLSAEYANSKVMLPRAKKPLEISTDGKWDKAKWDSAFKESGAAAKPGDQVQITKVDINDDSIVFEINGGLKSGRSWRDRVQIGMGNSTRPINSGGYQAVMGTSVELKFPKEIEQIEVAEVKKMLTPLFDFDKHSATESYVENLPPEIQAAIKAKKVIEGMDREQVILVLGRPRHKSRETNEGVETEDWVYGQAPGKITFVTFGGSKVTKVKESYAGLGGDLTLPNR